MVMAVLYGSPAVVTRPSLLPGLYLTYATLHALDVHSSLQALGHSGTREANPLLKGMRAPGLVAVKVASVTSTILLTEYLWKTGHRRMAVVTLLVINIGTGIVVVHNYQLTRD